MARQSVRLLRQVSTFTQTSDPVLRMSLSDTIRNLNFLLHVNVLTDAVRNKALAGVSVVVRVRLTLTRSNIALWSGLALGIDIVRQKPSEEKTLIWTLFMCHFHFLYCSLEDNCKLKSNHIGSHLVPRSLDVLWTPVEFVNTCFLEARLPYQ